MLRVRSQLKKRLIQKGKADAMHFSKNTTSPSKRLIFQSRYDVKQNVSKYRFAFFWTLEKKSTSRTFQTFIFFCLKKSALYVRMLNFFIHSVSNLCSNGLNFPAKKLRKNTAPKIRMRQFFFFLCKFQVQIYQVLEFCINTLSINEFLSSSEVFYFLSQ